MVRICAALAWCDETPEFLERCVLSLAGVVDDLVALDGPWRLFEAPDSGDAQRQAIADAAAAAGIDAYVTSAYPEWESQVHKRDELMKLASEGNDWVFVIDADEYVVHSDSEAIRKGLAETEHHCAFVSFSNLNQGESMPGTTPHSGLNRRLFRAGTTVRVVHSGYWYDGRSVVVEDALDLRHALALEHDNVNRGAERNQRARMYRARRDMTGAEKWVTL